MLKKWTQEELDAQRCDLAGVLDVGTGDFSGCDFYGRSRVVIGPGSIIGDNVALGDNCKVGDNCQIGAGFTCRQFCDIGEHCHFGENAHIGFASRIQSGCCLANGCVIDRETWIMEGVQLPRQCTVYGIEGVDGKTMMRIHPLYGRTVFAFRATGADGKARVWAGCTGVEMREIRAFTAYLRDRVRRIEFREHKAPGTWLAIEQAANYLEGYFESGLI